MKKNKVLFVDDEVNILNSIKRSVIFEDYSVMFAVDGSKAIEVVKNNDISVIVSDMRMPNMNGFELLEKVKEISPDTIRIVLSGYNQVAQVLATVNTVGVFKYITKPWNDELEFLPAIREAINYYNLKQENDSMKKELKQKNEKFENLLNTKDELIKKTEFDVLNIKSINNLIIQIQNILFSKVKSNVAYLDISEYYLKFINTIYAEFLNTFPTTENKFSMKILKEKLILKMNNNLEIDIDNMDTNYTGNLRLIILVMTELYRYIEDKHKIEDMSVKIISKPTLTIEFISLNVSLYNLYRSSVEFKLIINVLRELIKTSNGDLIIDETESNKIIIMTNI